MTTYIPDTTYRQLVDRLTNLPRGTDPDAVKIALGEAGGIWSASVAQDPEAELSEADKLADVIYGFIADTTGDPRLKLTKALLDRMQAALDAVPDELRLRAAARMQREASALRSA
ncbi:MAG: hypothetical protein KDK26_05490 [Roseivivax sp.]|nr:hypothetical protein [Roseivivax sp.]